MDNIEETDDKIPLEYVLFEELLRVNLDPLREKLKYSFNENKQGIDLDLHLAINVLRQKADELAIIMNKLAGILGNDLNDIFKNPGQSGNKSRIVSCVKTIIRYCWIL